MIGWLFVGLFLAALLFAFLGWWSRTDEQTARKALFWAIVVVCFALGGLLLATGKGLVAVVPGAFAAWRMLTGRARAKPSGRGRHRTAADPPPNATSMTEAEALDVLGLEEGASESDVKDAYKRLMSQLHPDKGGSDWMASKLNQARQVLLEK